ncbi:hypothetical protein [uncultured Senegalimassilia sp.]|uniref:hypothetical protein n=1 Tax=uncultured Senegalimassilia sp. TaxID=1714350 RepID=UPI00258F7C43|nr:hypothetical protein [uncultured Senegalimassilia sp.]
MSCDMLFRNTVFDLFACCAGRFFGAPFDQLPQKRREHQRHQIVRDEREVIAGSGYGSPEQARQTVEAPGDSVADQSGDADEYQDFRDLFLLQLVSEQVQDDAENQDNPDFDCRDLHALHIRPPTIPAIRPRCAPKSRGQLRSMDHPRKSGADHPSPIHSS